jgi:hypothetical protein
MYHPAFKNTCAYTLLKSRKNMKKVSLIPLCLVFATLMFSCSKDNPVNDPVIESATNAAELVKPGEPNCTESITSNVRIKVVVDSATSTSSSVSVKLRSRTEKLYPSGGYILVYDLARTSSVIKLEYKQVNTACGNPAAAAFLPATSAPKISNLSVGSYPIEIKINGVVNVGTLNIPASPGAPTLTMVTTNGLVIE